MFNFLTDSIENALDVADGLLSGEDIPKRQIARLISDGMTVAAISSMTGIAVNVIEDILED